MANEPVGELLLTASQVARKFQVHAVTVRRWVTEKRLEAFRTETGQLLFRQDVVEAALAKRETHVAPVWAAVMRRDANYHSYAGAQAKGTPTSCARPTYSGMSLTVEEAKALGMTPCSKCWPKEATNA